MGFPNLRSYAEFEPNPYERQMGAKIAALLRLFQGHAPDAESHACVLEVAESKRWTSAHAFFDEVRRRGNQAHDRAKAAQYFFEESCLQALYNATEPRDPFDPSSPYFVAPAAFAFASTVGVPLNTIIAAL